LWQANPRLHSGSAYPFRGAGQRPNGLIAEFIAGEIARAAGLPVPEIVCIALALKMTGWVTPDIILARPLLQRSSSLWDKRLG
jgi:hypothetical protein